MTAQITIRPARNEDREFVAGMATSLLEFPSPAWKEPAALARGYSEALARAVDGQDSGSAVFVAEDASGVPVGFISLRVGNDAAGFPRGHVADLAVVEGARLLGVGGALMAAGEKWAREHGLPVLGLDAWSTNDRALGFYRHLGYSPESLTLIKQLD